MVFCNIGLDCHSFTFDQIKLKFKKNKRKGSNTFCYVCKRVITDYYFVYMCRGDLGFCSVECRKRQIYLDEMKKIEIATKRILASFHQRRREGGGRCQAAKVPAEECFRQRRHPFLSDANRVIFS